MARLGLDSIDVLEVALVVSKRYGLQLRADDADNSTCSAHCAASPTISPQREPLMTRRILRWLGIATLLIGYSLLAHYTNNRRKRQPGALVAIAPWHCLHWCWSGVHSDVFSCQACLCWRVRRVGWMGGARTKFWAGLLVAISRHAASTVHHFRAHLDRRPPTAVHPLRGGIACAIVAAAEIYTRQVTLAWSVFFRDGHSLNLAVFPGTPERMVCLYQFSDVAGCRFDVHSRILGTPTGASRYAARAHSRCDTGIP